MLETKGSSLSEGRKEAVSQPKRGLIRVGVGRQSNGERLSGEEAFTFSGNWHSKSYTFENFLRV